MPKRKPPIVGSGVEIGVAWFREEDYPRFLRICSDSDSMEPTYGEWRSQAERAMINLRETVAVPHKVLIDPEGFIAWCESRSEPPNAAARSGYAAHLLALRRDRRDRRR